MRSDDPRMRELIAQTAAEWYVAHREGGLSEAQRSEFMRWLRSSPLHVAEYLAVAGMAHDIGEAARQHPASRDALLAEAGPEPEVIALWQQAPGMSPPAITRRRRRRRSWPALAAVATLLVAVTLWWAQPQLLGQQYVTRHGEQRTWQLPDNSVVRLNSDSAIRVRFREGHRQIDIRRGQVYFEVMSDPARPFHVRAGGHTIESIGTVFDVYRQGAATTVTVVEGRVRIWEQPPPEVVPADIDTRSGPPLAELAGGSQIRIDLPAAAPVTADRRAAASTAIPPPTLVHDAVQVQKATAWVQEKIIFRGDPIATVAEEFNRYNRQQIRIVDAGVGAIQISGNFNSYDVQSFVDFLNGLPGVRAELRERQILVSQAVSRPRAVPDSRPAPS